MKRILLIFFSMLPSIIFAQEKGIDQIIDDKFGEYTEGFVSAIFYTIPFTDTLQVPWVLIVLVCGIVTLV